MKFILITGGAGFIGSHVANKLVAKGHAVCVLDNLSTQVHGQNPESSPLYTSLHNNVKFIRGSVTNSENLREALSGIDTVVHLAAETGTGQSMYAINHYSDVNIVGTALLLDLIANESFPVNKIVVASSRAVYGEGRYHCSAHGDVYPAARFENDMARKDFELHCPVCNSVLRLLSTTEDSSLSPASVYGITKLTQEQMVLTVGKALGISAFAFRYQNVYGPGQSLSNPYTGILSIFSTRILNGKGINIFEDGKESRDFVYIDDVVSATISGVEYEAPIVAALNVGSGVSTDVLTIANLLADLLKKKVPVEITGQYRLGDIRHNVADLEKVKSLLGYKPEVTFQEGIRRFVDWVQGEQVCTDRYEESLEELRLKGLFK